MGDLRGKICMTVRLIPLKKDLMFPAEKARKHGLFRFSNHLLNACGLSSIEKSFSLTHRATFYNPQQISLIGTSAV